LREFAIFNQPSFICFAKNKKSQKALGITSLIIPISRPEAAGIGTVWSSHGCRGFIGPVPPPTLDEFYSVITRLPPMPLSNACAMRTEKA
jgi:hypothetical protein